jgi:hypothetical protein
MKFSNMLENWRYLQDLRSGYEVLQYARELEVAEESAAPAPAAEPVVDTIQEEDTIEEEAVKAPSRKRSRFSREQVVILQREYDRGTSRLSNRRRDIAVEIALKPEGIGRKVGPEDVRNWMSAKARRAKILAFFSSGAGHD